MGETTSEPSSGGTKALKRAGWGVVVFYLLIAVEFIYMTTPFAAYFYGVYSPALSFLGETPGLRWLPQFFLPHVVNHTHSPLIDLHNLVGAALFLGGLLAFCVGAGQVYWAKLRRKGAVTGGLYTVIRHPQYIAFIICSFGLLLLWPRYIALVLFITMVFAYDLLARLEEADCARKFGQSYLDYKARTGRFLPRALESMLRFPHLPASMPGKVLMLTAVYALCLASGIGVAYALKLHTINNLYAYYTPDAAYVSLLEIEEAKLERIARFVSEDETIGERLRAGRGDGVIVNYVLPADMSVSEIPMNEVEGPHTDHFMFETSKTHIVKIIAIQTDISKKDLETEGPPVLWGAGHRSPLLEIWLDPETDEVVKLLNLPAPTYGATPMPIL